MCVGVDMTAHVCIDHMMPNKGAVRLIIRCEDHGENPGVWAVHVNIVDQCQDNRVGEGRRQASKPATDSSQYRHK